MGNPNILYRRTGKYLPKNAFVFFIHQNYSFCFFYINEDKNPKVYQFLEPEDPAKIMLLHNSFSKFILNELNIFLECKKQQINKKVIAKQKKETILTDSFLERIIYIIIIFICLYLILR